MICLHWVTQLNGAQAGNTLGLAYNAQKYLKKISL